MRSRKLRLFGQRNLGYLVEETKVIRSSFALAAHEEYTELPWIWKWCMNAFFHSSTQHCFYLIDLLNFGSFTSELRPAASASLAGILARNSSCVVNWNGGWGWHQSSRISRFASPTFNSLLWSRKALTLPNWPYCLGCNTCFFSRLYPPLLLESLDFVFLHL